MIINIYVNYLFFDQSSYTISLLKSIIYKNILIKISKKNYFYWCYEKMMINIILLLLYFLLIINYRNNIHY